MSSFAAMPRLESLTLNVTNVTDGGLQQLASLKGLKELRLVAPLPAGGTRLVFALDAADPSAIAAFDLGHLTGGVGSRIWNATVLPSCVRMTEEHQLEVLLEGTDPLDVDAAAAAARKQGRMEFALLANAYEHAAVIAAAQENAADEVYQDGKLVAAWRRVGVKADGTPKEVGTEYGVLSRTLESGGKSFTEFLVVYEKGPEWRITSEHLLRARVDLDESRRPCIYFQLDDEGGGRLRFLTAAHMPLEASGFKSRLAILIDGEIHSAPSINDEIEDRGIIQGDFAQQEIEELVELLNSAKHEPALRPHPLLVEPFTRNAEDARTGVTAAAVDRLRQALPACKIETDF
jgi:SecD/SecF fusion protein